jgi:hypothetical protein
MPSLTQGAYILSSGSNLKHLIPKIRVTKNLHLIFVFEIGSEFKVDEKYNSTGGIFISDRLIRRGHQMSARISR